MKNKKVAFLNWGLIDYQEAWTKQEELFDAVVSQKIANRDKSEEEKKPTSNYLVFCQHPHVFTLGKSGKSENLLLDDQGLKERSASFYKINRGGDITYHGPGQLVVYPIFDLDNFFTDIHKFMRFMEEAVIATLAEFGLKAGRINGLTGVWLGHENDHNPRKICAMGVKASRWVTMHGLALNVSPDLGYFSNIVPCGIDDKAVCSMESELNKKIEISSIASILQKHFIDLFEMESQENGN